MNGVGLLGGIVIGILSGWIAEHAMGRKHGLMTNLVVGLVGSMVGALLARLIGVTAYGWWSSLVVSSLGAVVLLAVVGALRQR